VTTQRANVLCGLVVAILSVTLFIPAIRRGRAEAARTESLDHLRSLGLALRAFDEQNRTVPPAFDKSSAVMNPVSVHVHLLPFLGQDKLFHGFQSGQGDDQAVVASFQAPSDGTLGNGAGVQNFAANLRLFTARGWSLEADEDLTAIGPIESCGRGLLIERIQQGAQSTAAFAEKYAVCGDGGSRYAANPTSRFAAFFGQNHAQLGADPKDPTAAFQLAPSGADCRTSPLMAQSFDRTVILVGLADGSARKVKPTVSPETWNRVISPSGR
jgi:hypothetical protein